jgi:DNA-binding transcriptional LysR family regulator
MDRLTAISTFVKVVDARGFSAAAFQLRVSPAVVSTRIQSLERRLGVRLLNRTTRSVALTDSGRSYYERCAAFLYDMDEAEQAARSADSATCGRLRLNVAATLGHDVPRLVCEYARRHPGVAFEITTSAQMPDLVGDGFDLAIRTGPLPDSSMTTRRLGTTWLTLCAAPAYFALHGRPRHVNELVDHACLRCLGVCAKGQWTFKRADETHRIPISGWLRANTIESLKAVAMAGQGIALLPERSVIGDLEAGRLVRLLPEFEPVGADVHVIFPSARQASAKVRSFVEFLARRFHLEARGARPVCAAIEAAELVPMASAGLCDASPPVEAFFPPDSGSEIAIRRS